MSKKLRDWLFIIFIALFVIITFFVSIYAVGYRINTDWPPRFSQIFQRTGMLIVDSEPKGATIFLDEEKLRRSFLLDLGRSDLLTPNKVKNLVPGEYNLRLEKEGYWPLEKKIYIYPGQTTFAENFILFKRSLPLNLSYCLPQTISISPDKKNLILPETGTVINLKTSDSSSLENKTSNQQLQWSQDSAKVLFAGQILNLDGKKSGYDLSLLGAEAKNFYWDEANKKIYYQTDNNISCVLTDQNTISTILSGNDYIAYTVKNGLIYTIEKQAGQNYLRLYDANSALLRSNENLPVGDYIFTQDEYHLNLYDRKQQALYLISNYAAQAINKQIRPVVNWQWLSETFLVWYNEFEIYSLDTNSNREELLIRVSEPLTGMAWNQAKNYLIYANDQQIQIINLNLDKKTPITLLKASQISNLVLDEKNQLLYFYAKIGQQEGVYKLQLQ